MICLEALFTTAIGRCGVFLETTGSTVFFWEWLSQLTSKKQFCLAVCYYIPQTSTQCYPNIAVVDVGTQPFEYDLRSIQSGKDKCFQKELILKIS